MKEYEFFRGGTRVVAMIMLGLGLTDAFGSIFTFLGLQQGKPYSGGDRAAAAMAYIISGLIIIGISQLLSSMLYRNRNSS